MCGVGPTFSTFMAAPMRAPSTVPAPRPVARGRCVALSVLALRLDDQLHDPEKVRVGYLAAAGEQLGTRRFGDA